MVREVVFDTETTGMDPETGDKLVEIGAVELINHIPTGVTFHRYINPQREVPEDAFKVHGLNYDFLKDKHYLGLIHLAILFHFYINLYNILILFHQMIIH